MPASTRPISRASAARLASMFAAIVVCAGLAAPVPAKMQPRNPEDLLIVDCLLPGQIRKLGRQATFMSARRPVRTTQADCEIRGGEYVSYDRANYQTALKVWMEQAITGDAEAQNYVGEIYAKGLGTEPDYAMAAQWFQKAAAQGYKRAKISLGYLYEQGLGVRRDLARALNLYRDASGVEDELLFASQVEVEMKAKEGRISQLESEVERERETSAQLRQEVEALRAQLEQRRQALQRSQGEIQALQGRLAEVREATGADLSSLDAMKAEMARRQAAIDERAAALAKAAEDTSGQAAVLQAQLQQDRAQLARERERYQAEIERLQAQAEGRKKEDWELMRLLENQLAAKEAEIREARSQIGRLETRLASGAASGPTLAAAPMLELINPPLTVTRGKPAAVLRGGAGQHRLVGKVTAPQGIASVSVNGSPVELAATGVFETMVEVPGQGVTVEVSARDRNGAEASLDFLMIPQAGGAQPVMEAPSRDTRAPTRVDFGRYYAVVIGNNRYQDDGYQALSSAANDATAVAELLRRRYGYETTLLLDASRFDILSALNAMRESLTEKDNLLVYYAGHGELDQGGGQGYWIPVDARAGEPNTWISNAAISDILNTMKARHVLVVADSCYSGTLTRSSVPTFDADVMPAGERNGWLKTMASARSRTALTSGAVQPVPDVGSGKHSYFARAFLNVLSDNTGLLEAERLYRELSTTLAVAAMDSPVPQFPQYSPIRFAGHESGDFFFMPVATTRAGP